MGPVSLTRRFWNLTDVTLADGDIKSILTDTANRAIQGNVAMHVTHPVNLVIKFWTNARVPSSGKICGAIWLPNFELMQVAPYGDQILNEGKWRDLVTKFRTNSSSANEILKDLLKIWSQYPGSGNVFTESRLWQKMCIIQT